MYDSEKQKFVVSRVAQCFEENFDHFHACVEPAVQENIEPPIQENVESTPVKSVECPSPQNVERVGPLLREHMKGD